MEEFRLDESRKGDLLDQVVEGATGYGDQLYLNEQKNLAKSDEAPADVRANALGNVVRIVFDEKFGERRLAEQLKKSLDGQSD